MRVAELGARFLQPRWLVTLRLLLRDRCFVSPRAEVELTRNLEIGAGTAVGAFTKIKTRRGPMRIGADTDIATGCFITSHEGGVEIGDHCLIGPNVSIVGSNYRYDRLDVPIKHQETVSRGIRIESDVWIGAGSAVLDGVRIGKGSIVVPNSVVTADVPERSIVQGQPARVIFTRRG